MSRSKRRHHKARIKAKVRNIMKVSWKWPKNPTDKQIGKASSHHHSCGICGNARKWEGDTLQERLSKEDLKEQWEEYLEIYYSRYHS